MLARRIEQVRPACDTTTVEGRRAGSGATCASHAVEHPVKQNNCWPARWMTRWTHGSGKALAELMKLTKRRR
jgi:hypothetical protein